MKTLYYNSVLNFVVQLNFKMHQKNLVVCINGQRLGFTSICYKYKQYSLYFLGQQQSY